MESFTKVLPQILQLVLITQDAILTVNGSTGSILTVKQSVHQTHLSYSVNYFIYNSNKKFQSFQGAKYTKL